MKLMQLVGFINDITGLKTYPLEFPYNSEQEDVLVVDIINGDMTGSVIEMNIQIMTRSTHPSFAEELASMVINTLHNKTNNQWDGWQVILVQATNPNPFYTGQDDSNHYIYITDFRVLVSK